MNDEAGKGLVDRDRLARWHQAQREIAECSECLRRWSGDVIHPLAASEIPEPPPTIDILFVGVAPTPELGQHKGAHFYSSASDRLRRGLFGLLSRADFGLSLVGLSLLDGNTAFHAARCFFVHAAKVRPITDPAPPPDAISVCAGRHLRQEVLLLRPKAVCFLGLNNASTAADALFARDLRGRVKEVGLDDWRGLSVVTNQPIRGWADKTLAVVRDLWQRTRGARSAARAELH